MYFHEGVDVPLGTCTLCVVQAFVFDDVDVGAIFTGQPAVQTAAK